MTVPAAALGEDRDSGLVSVSWLKDRTDSSDFVIVDVRSPEAYAKGHIPNAVNLDVFSLATRSNVIVLPPAKLEQILGAKGLSPNKHLVLYGEGKEQSFRAYWTLNYIGFDRLAVLDGGIEEWNAAKLPLSKEDHALPAVQFTAQAVVDRHASTKYVLDHLNDPNVILVDARTPAEFTGEDIRALRGGHIPGAINIPYESNFISGTTKLKPWAELEQLYAKLDKNKEIIVYCQTGQRAANAYYVLRQLGFKVRNYDASWIQWGSNANLPAEDESYFNFFPYIRMLREWSQFFKHLQMGVGGGN